MSRPVSPGDTLRVRRREVLAAVGIAGGLTVAGGSRAADDRGATAASPLHVRVYPGPVPPWVWLRYGPRGVDGGWPEPFRAALSAVSTACDRIATHAGVEATVERGPPIGRQALAVRPAVPTRGDVLDAFREVLHRRGLVTGHTCHLLCWWGPAHPGVGYGGVRRPNSHVARDPAEGTQAVVNVGATEVWDSRAVTRNMAVHEVLHAYLTAAETDPLVGTGCDHDLGAVGRSDGTLTVSPMATAYATPPRIGVGTRWPGSGCRNAVTVPDLEAVSSIEYTTTLSDATLAGVSRYLDRTDPA